MKTFTTMSVLGLAGAVAYCSSCASAFVLPSAAAHVHAVAAPTSTQSIGRDNCRRTSMVLSAEKADGKEEEQEPMDLDLEQMFEVFEAADKEVTDEEVGKKGGKKTGAGAKDPAEAMGDMLSSFFGGGKK
ncbi:unnamed protein product [Hapterophycus canaliculatus]